MSLEEQKSKINTQAASSGLRTAGNTVGWGCKEYVVCMDELPGEDSKEL